MSFEPYPYSAPTRETTPDDGYPEPTNPMVRSTEKNWYDSHGFSPRRNYATYPGSSSEGVGALVCGIMSLLFCGILFGPIAIHLGGQSESGMARAGRVMGIIGTVFGVIGLLTMLIQLTV